MQFPETVTVVVVDARSGAPVGGVAIMLRLFARRKNDYHVGPAISDGEGIVRITREDRRRAIRSAREMFLMDYWGGLEDCAPRVEIALHDPKHVAGMLDQYADAPSFWGHGFVNPAELFARLAFVRNAEYESARVQVDESRLAVDARVESPLTRER